MKAAFPEPEPLVTARAPKGPASAPGKGFKSFNALKQELGPAGEGKVWHHIVEQRACNIERFGAEAIHNTTNVASVPCEVNQAIAGYYSRIRPFTGGKTVRGWLGSKSWRKQFEFGRDVMNRALGGEPLP